MRYLLLAVGLDETQLHPISKTLYPTVASHYQVNIAQIERDIRYSLHDTDLHRQGLTTTAAISRMYHELIHLAESAAVAPDSTQSRPDYVYEIDADDMEKPSVSLVSDGGYLPEQSNMQ
jgi:hypothetical protein